LASRYASMAAGNPSRSRSVGRSSIVSRWTITTDSSSCFTMTFVLSSMVLSSFDCSLHRGDINFD
jgi:hypothetical protein